VARAAETIIGLSMFLVVMNVSRWTFPPKQGVEQRYCKRKRAGDVFSVL